MALALEWSSLSDLSDLNVDQQCQETIGNIFSIVFTCVTGTVDVSAWSFSALIAPDVDSAARKQWLDASFSAKTSGGSFTLSVITADTSTLPGRSYYIEVRRVDGAHNEVISKGFISLSPSPNFTPIPPATGTVAWARIVDTPTTLAGYGITDGAAGGDALRSQNLDQFADVTQSAGKTLAITESTTLAGGTHSGVNTGDQTNISGNAATVSVVDAGADATCWLLVANSQTGPQSPATINGATANAVTGVLTMAGFAGPLTGNVTGNAATATLASTVTTNANLTGVVTSIGNATAFAASPAFTGVPTAPTASLGTNTTQVATTAFVLANSGGILINDGNSSTAKTIDFSAGITHKVTLTGNCTFAFTAPTAGARILLDCVADGTSGRTRTWPGTVIWTGGTAPAALNSGEVQQIVGFYNGTNYYLDYTPSALTTFTANSVTGLSVVASKILTVSNTLTFAGTDGSTLNIGTGGSLGALAFLSSFPSTLPSLIIGTVGGSVPHLLSSQNSLSAANGNKTVFLYVDGTTAGIFAYDYGAADLDITVGVAGKKAFLAGDKGSIGASVTIGGAGGALAQKGVGACYNNKALYLYNDDTFRVLDAYDYQGAVGLPFKIGGNGGVVTLDAVLNLPIHANSSPADGDLWRVDNTNTGVKLRVNGVTKTITLS